MSKQKILFISPQPFFEWRGSSIRVKFTVQALSELGYEVDLLTLPIGEEHELENVRVLRVWNIFGSKSIAIGPSLQKLWFDLLLLIKGTYLVTTRNYSVLHGTEEAGAICWILSRLSGTKTIYEKHSDSGSYRSNKKRIKGLMLDAYDWVERHTIRKSSLVITTGPALSAQAKEHTDDTNILTIPDIPSSQAEPTNKEISATRKTIQKHDDEILVTYVGSFAEYQGIDMLFDCMADVIERNPAIRFMIIGGSDEEIAYYKKQLNQQGLTTEEPNPQVDFRGKINPEDLTLYLAASDILLVPRKSGINSPLKILDFFKAGRAIVATDTAANRRLLNEHNAELCTMDAPSFADGILHLSNNPEKRAYLGANGYGAYKRKYNFSVFKTQLRDAYKGLMVGSVVFLHSVFKDSKFELLEAYYPYIV